MKAVNQMPRETTGMGLPISDPRRQFGGGFIEGTRGVHRANETQQSILEAELVTAKSRLARIAEVAAAVLLASEATSQEDASLLRRDALKAIHKVATK